jgi:hypothetical protein
MSRCAEYILKYHTKGEPSFTASFQRDTYIIAQINSRYVSYEEAIARIYSLSFCQHDTQCLFKTASPPEIRCATFRNDGDQLQMDSVDIYYNRPQELERITFLDFYSQFAIEKVSDPNTNTPICTIDRSRPPNTLLPNSVYESENFQFDDEYRYGLIFRSTVNSNLPLLAIRKRRKPAIVITTKFNINSNPEHFYFHYLFLSGSWRLDNEILANCET